MLFTLHFNNLSQYLFPSFSAQQSHFKSQIFKQSCIVSTDLKYIFLDTFEIIQNSKITVKKPNALPKAKYAAYSMKKSRK